MLAVLLTPPTTLPGEASTLVSLCARSVPPTSIHVRKPGLGRDQLAAYVRSLDPAVRRRVVLHSHHDLAGELGVKVRSGEGGERG